MSKSFDFTQFYSVSVSLVASFGRSGLVLGRIACLLFLEYSKLYYYTKIFDWCCRLNRWL